MLTLESQKMHCNSIFLTVKAFPEIFRISFHPRKKKDVQIRPSKVCKQCRNTRKSLYAQNLPLFKEHHGTFKSLPPKGFTPLPNISLFPLPLHTHTQEKKKMNSK